MELYPIYLPPYNPSSHFLCNLMLLCVIFLFNHYSVLRRPMVTVRFCPNAHRLLSKPGSREVSTPPPGTSTTVKPRTLSEARFQRSCSRPFPKIRTVAFLGLRIFDRIHGPEPPTPADFQRDADHERLVTAFPSNG
jgi:hypothetical protein